MACLTELGHIELLGVPKCPRCGFRQTRVTDVSALYTELDRVTAYEIRDDSYQCIACGHKGRRRVLVQYGVFHDCLRELLLIEDPAEET